MRQVTACVCSILLWVAVSSGQDLIQQAAEAWGVAQSEEASLRSLPSESLSRNDYLRVIRLYERVYLTTPHSGYSDDALIHIATLYEDTEAFGDAIRTLRFLVSDYPASKHIPEARDRILRLAGDEGVQSLPPPVAVNRDPAEGGRVRVDDVRYWEEDGTLRVVVDLDGEPVFRRGSLANPPRVYLDVQNAQLGNIPRRAIEVSSAILRGIRVAQFDPDTVRVVLDLSAPSSVDAFTLTGPDRLVVDVLAPASAPQVTSSSSEAPAPAPPPIEAPVASASPPVEAVEEAPVAPAPEIAVTPSVPAQPTENGNYTLNRILGLKPSRVVIDPGHGGFDPGTIGPSGLSEAELVLDVAMRLKERIEEEIPSAEVLLTRSDNTFVPLEARPLAANEAEADLFISIHANSSQIQSIRGFETYFLSLEATNEEMEVAGRENASSQLPFSELQHIVQQIMVQEWVQESREFAGHIQKALASGDDLGRDRGVKQAPLVVLAGAQMPSILAEVSFISNPADEVRLKGSERRQEIADALFEGIRSYFGTLAGYRTAEVRD